MIAVTKSVIGKSGATLTADADIDVDSKACIDVFGLPGDPHDSEEAFFEDMIVEGDYTNDQTLVEIHVTEAAKRTKELIDWGARIDRLTSRARPSVPPRHLDPGSGVPPGARPRGARSGRARLLQYVMVTDLLKNGERGRRVPSAWTSRPVTSS